MFVSSEIGDYLVKISKAGRDDYSELYEVWSSSRNGLNHSNAPACLVDTNSERDILIFKIYKGNELIAYFPFEEKSFFGIKIVTPAYSELTLDFIDISSKPEYQNMAVEMFLNWIKSQENVVFYLFMLNENSVLVQYANKDQAFEVEPRGKYFHLDLPGSNEEFLETLSKSSRKTFKRQLAKYEGLMKVEIVDNKSLGDELETAIGNLVSLHSELFPHDSAMLPHLETFKPWIRKAISNDAAFFIRTREFATGDIVATEILMKAKDAIGLMQGGRKVDEQYSGIGSWQLNSLIIWAIENGYKRFEFLFGDQEYKRRLATAEKNAVSITYFSSSYAKFVFKTRHRLGNYFSFLR